jgi:hypothetical protein
MSHRDRAYWELTDLLFEAQHYVACLNRIEGRVAELLEVPRDDDKVVDAIFGGEVMANELITTLLRRTQPPVE